MDQFNFWLQLYAECVVMCFVFFYGVMYVAGRCKAEGHYVVIHSAAIMAVFFFISIPEIFYIMSRRKDGL